MTKRVNIIGGGIAGCALAYMIKQEGGEPVIYEAASSLYGKGQEPEHDCSTYNPRYSAQWDENAQYFSMGYFEALRLFEEFGGDGFNWNQCGTLQLIANERKARRYPKTVASWGAHGWSEEDMRFVSAKEASDIAGLDVETDCMYLGRAGVISPWRLCSKLINGVEVKLNQWVEDVSALEGDATVLACGTKVTSFKEAAHLPISGVRGQVTFIRETDVSSKVKTTINYGGHISPALDGVHYIGATFQPWLKHTDILPEDDVHNIRNMCERFPALADKYELVCSRAGVRTAAKDHFPIIGQLSDRVYISTAHGSHGVISALSSAMILAKSIVRNEDVISKDVLKIMSPERF
ncbi:MAG: FAD-dependent 5-carboxymethylaminomethyl-2-thiouridine(34) oxidoreductase MnmC [Alphaproteobacteria bacterium]|nr:FAD-dependent 5-carboxymethylaminomethyl-2-thiouridine(34) oxidoreductase MnmC [Alphaproteobacteria bacterium]